MSALVVYLSAIAVSITALTGIVYAQAIQDVQTVQADVLASQAIAPAQSEPEQPSEPAAPADEPTLGVAGIAAQSAPESVAEQPEAVELPFSAEMTAAGIPAAQQPVAREIIVLGDELNIGALARCACYRLIENRPDVQIRFNVIHEYVTRIYGSWQAASDNYASQGAW